MAAVERLSFDALVVGGGIAGIEAAINLGDNGLRVLLVEKDLTLGGKMIMLSKVFPTLDCAACITTPKISEVARHPNVTIFTNTEVKSIQKQDMHYFKASLVRHPRYVDESACTGCQLCEEACPAVVPDQYQYDLVGRKAAYIPFSIASPRVATIDMDHCVLCGACERVCPPQCIDFTQEPAECQIIMKTVIVATGLQLFDPARIERFRSGHAKNVITAMQMERLLAPTRPYNHVLRPGDGKAPDKIAYVLCVGSRDRTVGNPICSQICCMYSIKQAQLLMGALPMADVTIYYINIRSYGKGFEEFYEQAKGMGVNFVKGKVGQITEKENGNLVLRYEDIRSGRLKEAEHDLVVLSVGSLADPDASGFFTDGRWEQDEFHFPRQKDLFFNPALSSIKGVFLAGTTSCPMDIPDTILSAGAASMEAIRYIKQSALGI
ncbi:MAG: CoB--CoM heterodisulfide reductase iron-sulfur subunit A family protein [Candidatus Aminicenantes bacterium]|nr:CoB--CoM heterodisulfide reductase iron-sulfur subunit A family protein [Candidatus Aminicenantes bacterium]